MLNCCDLSLSFPNKECRQSHYSVEVTTLKLCIQIKLCFPQTLLFSPTPVFPHSLIFLWVQFCAYLEFLTLLKRQFLVISEERSSYTSAPHASFYSIWFQRESLLKNERFDFKEKVMLQGREEDPGSLFEGAIFAPFKMLFSLWILWGAQASLRTADLKDVIDERPQSTNSMTSLSLCFLDQI